jgi:hypothetical protein
MVRVIAFSLATLVGIALMFVAGPNTSLRVAGAIIAVSSLIGAVASWWSWAHHDT